MVGCSCPSKVGAESERQRKPLRPVVVHRILTAENGRQLDAIGAAGRARAVLRGANRDRTVLGGRELPLEQIEFEIRKRGANEV
jgi:hypothetical protein